MARACPEHAKVTAIPQQLSAVIEEGYTKVRPHSKLAHYLVTLGFGKEIITANESRGEVLR
jgi:hypothetical protein